MWTERISPLAVHGGGQRRTLVILRLDGSGSGAVAYDCEHVRRGRMMKIRGNQVAVLVALGAFVLAAWAVSRDVPQTAPTEPSPPDDTQSGVERARQQMENQQHDGGDRGPSDRR